MDEYFICFFADYTAGPGVPKSITTKLTKIPCSSSKKFITKRGKKKGNIMIKDSVLV